MKKQQYKLRKEQAQAVCAMLKPRYKAAICHFDPTAVEVVGITDKQHSALCRELHCSGHYSEILRMGVLTNFGMYK